MSAMLCPSRRSLAAFAILSVWLCFSASSFAQESADGIQTWLDETGQHKIQAKFVKIDGANVVLQTAEGKQLNVPYAKLSLSSQFRAKKMADAKAFEAAPLPSSIKPPPVSDNPFPADPTVEQFLDTLLAQLKEGHADVLWHAMPAGAQADVEAIVIRSAEIAGPKLLKQMQAVLPNVLTIVRDKRSFIVANPRIARMPDVAKRVSVGLQASEPLVDLATRPSTWSSENFKQGNVAPWIMLVSNDLLTSFMKMGDTLKAGGMMANAPAADLKSISYKVIEKTADTATVEFISPANPTNKRVVLKKVDGKWGDSETEAMYASLAEARSKLDSMDKAAIDEFRMNMSTGLTFANGFLGSLANAKTAQEFNALIEPYMTMVDAQLANVRNNMASPMPGGIDPFGAPAGSERQRKGPASIGGPPANPPRSQPPSAGP